MTGATTPRALVVVGLAMSTLTSACKASPCSDEALELQPHLAELPVLDDKASVCISYTEESGSESAMVMQWGDDLAPIETRLIVAMGQDGWGQVNCWSGGTESPHDICFEKGDYFLRASFSEGESKSMGLEKAALITHLTWYETKH